MRLFLSKLRFILSEIWFMVEDITELIVDNPLLFVLVCAAILFFIITIVVRLIKEA